MRKAFVLMEDLESITAAALEEFAACADPAALENSKARYLGKTGQLSELLKSLGKLSAADRPVDLAGTLLLLSAVLTGGLALTWAGCRSCTSRALRGERPA